VETVTEWLKSGIPTGPKAKLKLVELAADLPAILKAIRQAGLDTEDAMIIVSVLRERELVDLGAVKTGPGREKFIPFLSRFLDLDRSPYLKDKIAHDHRITQKYCRIKRTEYSTFKYLCDRHRLDYLWDEKDESGRSKREITITEMAKKLGFIGKNGKGQESKLSQYENRREGPPLELVEKYAECFGLKGKAKFDLFYEALKR
jgi:hypothetical protein